MGDALLDLRLGSGLGPCGKREDSCILPLIEPRQQHDVAIGELERVMIDVKRALVDLAKDRNGVAGIGSKHEGGLILDWFFERQFGARKYADSHRTILRRGESSRARTEVVYDEFFAHFGWACLHRVQTVVAHKGTPHVGAPRSAILTETAPGASIANRRRRPLFRLNHLAARLGRNDRSRSKAAEMVVTMRQPVRIAPEVDILQLSLPAASSLRKRDQQFQARPVAWSGRPLACRALRCRCIMPRRPAA